MLRDANFSLFAYKWVNLGYVLLLTGQMGQVKNLGLNGYGSKWIKILTLMRIIS